MNTQELQNLIAQNTQAIAEFRQQMLDETVRLSRAQAEAWGAIAQTNRTVDRVTTSQLQLTQAIQELRAHQAQQQHIFDYLLRQEQNRESK